MIFQPPVPLPTPWEEIHHFVRSQHVSYPSNPSLCRTFVEYNNGGGAIAATLGLFTCSLQTDVPTARWSDNHIVEVTSQNIYEKKATKERPKLLKDFTGIHFFRKQINVGIYRRL
jgi:hypothetical protein